MKITDRNLVLETAQTAVQQLAPMLVGWVGNDNAANLVAQIYDFYEAGRVITEHYTITQFGVNEELTVIASPERISLIGRGHTHYTTLPCGYIAFNSLQQDIEAIARIVQFQLQFLV